MNTFTDKLKNVLLIVLLAGLAAFAIAYFIERGKRTPEGVNNFNAGKIDLHVEPEKIYTDTEGRQHTVIDADKNTFIQSEANKIVNDQLKPVIDSIAKRVGVKGKQIESSTTISTTSQATDLKAMRSAMDSLRRLTIYYKDKYLELAYRPAIPGDTTDLGSFDYKYNADLDIDQYWKRAFILGRKSSYLDIFSNDKRTTINGVKRLQIEQKDPGFGVRVQALGNYDLRSKLLQPGAGLTIDIGPFSARSALFYNANERRFTPTIEGAFTIFGIK